MTEETLKAYFDTKDIHKWKSFVKSEWEEESSFSYLFYKWIHVVSLLALLISSAISDIITTDHDLQYHVKWLIYLTNWALLLILAQGILSLVLMIKSRRGSLVAGHKYIFSVYGALNNTSVTIALGTTFMFWCFVYNPDEYELNLQTLSSHIGNSVVMLIDFALVGHEFKLLHLFYPIMFVSTYTFFNFVYYSLGGRSRKDTVTIYQPMDWRKPKSCLVFVLSGFVLVLTIHVFIWIIYALKKKLSEQFRIRKNQGLPLHVVSEYITGT